MYDAFTFSFKDAKFQKEFDEYLMLKPIDAGVLKGELVIHIPILV